MLEAGDIFCIDDILQFDKFFASVEFFYLSPHLCCILDVLELLERGSSALHMNLFWPIM